MANAKKCCLSVDEMVIKPSVVHDQSTDSMIGKYAYDGTSDDLKI